MRLIDADELKLKIVEEGQQSKRYKIGDFWELNRNEIWRAIDDLPTIEERKTGNWIIEPHEVKGMYIHRCGVCMNVLMVAPTNRPKYSYCPRCGARMER